MKGTRKSRSDFGFGRDADDADDAEEWLKNQEWLKNHWPNVMRIAARLAA